MSVKKSIHLLLLLTALLLINGTEPDASRAAQSHPDGFVSGPNPAAPLLGPEFQISTTLGVEGDYYHPALAYNLRHDEYLIVYELRRPNSSRAIGWSRCASDGSCVVSFLGSSGQKMQPAVAYNYTDDQYLIVYMYDPTGMMNINSPFEIGGTLCSYDLTCGSEFRIFNWANRGFWNPRVVWNSIRDEYFVIWNAIDTNTGLYTDVAGVHVSPSGVVDGLPHIITTVNYPQQADISYNLATNRYLVVWRRMWTSAIGNVWGATVNADGSLYGSEFIINATTADHQSPAVTTNQQDRYFVVWQEQTSGSAPWQIVGQELDVNGNGVGSTIPGFPPSGNQTNPAVIAKPGVTGDYMVIGHYLDSSGLEGIIGSRFTPTSSQLLTVQLAQSWNYANPAVAIGRPDYLIVYEGKGPSGYRNIYGRLWFPEALFLPLTLH